MEDRAWRALRPVYSEAMRGASYPYPYGGYLEGLEEIVERAIKAPSMRALDLSAEAGNLSALLRERGCAQSAWCDHGERGALLARLPGLDVLERTEGASLSSSLSGGVELSAPLMLPCTKRFEVALYGGEAFTGAELSCVSAWFIELFEQVLTPKAILWLSVASFESERARSHYEPPGAPSSPSFEVWQEALAPLGLHVRYSQLMPCRGVFKIRRP